MLYAILPMLRDRSVPQSDLVFQDRLVRPDAYGLMRTFSLGANLSIPFDRHNHLPLYKTLEISHLPSYLGNGDCIIERYCYLDKDVLYPYYARHVTPFHQYNSRTVNVDHLAIIHRLLDSAKRDMAFKTPIGAYSTYLYPEHQSTQANPFFHEICSNALAKADPVGSTIANAYADDAIDILRRMEKLEHELRASNHAYIKDQVREHIHWCISLPYLDTITHETLGGGLTKSLIRKLSTKTTHSYKDMPTPLKVEAGLTTTINHPSYRYVVDILNELECTDVRLKYILSNGLVESTEVEYYLNRFKPTETVSHADKRNFQRLVCQVLWAFNDSIGDPDFNLYGNFEITVEKTYNEEVFIFLTWHGEREEHHAAYLDLAFLTLCSKGIVQNIQAEKPASPVRKKDTTHDEPDL